MTANSPDDTLSETENFLLWRSEEEDGVVYHLELGPISIHLQGDEWDELVTLIRAAETS